MSNILEGSFLLFSIVGMKKERKLIANKMMWKIISPLVSVIPKLLI